MRDPGHTTSLPYGSVEDLPGAVCSIGPWDSSPLTDGVPLGEDVAVNAHDEEGCNIWV